jgi:hypothetical protein
MKNQETLTEMYCVGNCLMMVAQKIQDVKLGLQISKIGIEMIEKAGNFNHDLGDILCPKSNFEIFLEWLKKHGPGPCPPIPPYAPEMFENGDILVSASTKPLPPKNQYKIKPLALLNYFNELFLISKNIEIQKKIGIASVLVSDFYDGEIPICGTIIKGPKPRPF